MQIYQSIRQCNQRVGQHRARRSIVDFRRAIHRILKPLDGEGMLTEALKCPTLIQRCADLDPLQVPPLGARRHDPVDLRGSRTGTLRTIEGKIHLGAQQRYLDCGE